MIVFTEDSYSVLARDQTQGANLYLSACWGVVTHHRYFTFVGRFFPQRIVLAFYSIIEILGFAHFGSPNHSVL